MGVQGQTDLCETKEGGRERKEGREVDKQIRLVGFEMSMVSHLCNPELDYRVTVKNSKPAHAYRDLVSKTKKIVKFKPQNSTLIPPWPCAVVRAWHLEVFRTGTLATVSSWSQHIIPHL